MTDRELLELAAKAAGLEHMKWTGLGLGRMIDPNRPDSTGIVGKDWNPLTDDGDALRLAVKLGIDIEFSHPGEQQEYVIASRRGCEMMFDPVKVIEDIDGYRDAATRRAIVRAAAAIGERMP